MHSNPKLLNRFVAAVCAVIVASAALAGSVSVPASKLDRIGDAAVTRSQKTVTAAAAAIIKAAAKGRTEKALTAAARARAKLESIADKAHASLDKLHASLEKKLATDENADQLMLALDFTAHQVDNTIDLYLAQCLEDVDQALADAGLAEQ